MFIRSYWSFVLVLFFSTACFASNKTLFEGYYRILLQGQHVGYYIQRYEIDPAKKQFISTYFLRTNPAGGSISESVKAYATEKLKPIKYQYTSLQGKVAKTIDANVRKNKKGQDVLQVKINENGKLRVSEKILKKEGVFFSTFLIYLLLQGKKGIQPGVKYDFNAIAEEDGKVFPGEVYVESETRKMNQAVYKVLYTFKRTQFVNFINRKGESMISVSPALGLSAELVKNPTDATKNMKFNNNSISLLFGGLPAGLMNQLQETTSPKSPALKASKKDTLDKPKRDQ